MVKDHGRILVVLSEAVLVLPGQTSGGATEKSGGAAENDLLLRSQILYARGTLEEALEQVGKKSDGPVAQIFKETAEQLRCQDGRSFYESGRCLWNGTGKSFF